MDNELFDLAGSHQRLGSVPQSPMTAVQRQAIRELFAKLGITTASEQFSAVADLTGVRVASVAEVKVDTANVLIRSLQGRVARLASGRSGNAWADREEDTWIDRL
jgi:hypothetical protein